MPPVCISICPFTCQSLMSCINAAVRYSSILSVSSLNTAIWPLFSWCSLFLPVFSLSSPLSLSIWASLSSGVWCEPQTPFQHLLLPLRPLQQQPKVGLQLRLPQSPTLELVGDWESVCVCERDCVFESVVVSYYLKVTFSVSLSPCVLVHFFLWMEKVCKVKKLLPATESSATEMPHQLFPMGDRGWKEELQ